MTFLFLVLSAMQCFDGPRRASRSLAMWRRREGFPRVREAKQEFGMLLASCMILADSLSFH